jgi:hypothetical protein
MVDKQVFENAFRTVCCHDGKWILIWIKRQGSQVGRAVGVTSWVSRLLDVLLGAWHTCLATCHVAATDPITAVQACERDMLAFYLTATRRP